MYTSYGDARDEQPVMNCVGCRSQIFIHSFMQSIFGSFMHSILPFIISLSKPAIPMWALASETDYAVCLDGSQEANNSKHIATCSLFYFHRLPCSSECLVLHSLNVIASVVSQNAFYSKMRFLIYLNITRFNYKIL